MRTLTALLGTVVLLGLPACADLDEDIITGVTDEFYATPEGFEAAVSAAYSFLRSTYAQERGFTLTAFGTDEFTKGADGSHKFYNDYTPQLNGDASFVRDTWRDHYRAINSVNAAIGRSKDVPVDETYKNQRLAEVHFLRAFYYFDLVRMYGDVPLSLEEITTPETEANRDPAAQVYEAIIADLL